MIHEGRRLEQEIERLSKELEQPIGQERRINIQAAILRLKQKKRDWEAPKAR